MIYFLVRDSARWGIADYLREWGRPLANRVGTVSYEEVLDHAELPAGTYIFTLKDELLPGELEVARALWDQLSESPATRLLNDPRQVMGRYDLLDTLYRASLNDFKARRATEDRSCLEYPVFVREERAHTGSLTPLLASPRDLARALDRLAVRGFRRSDLLVVEFCDTSDSDGVFRKYSAYVVDTAIVPRSILHSDEWMVKSGTLNTNDERLAEERSYIAANPHREWLERVMRTAGVQYGRIDYGVKGDRPQAWEINLYPTLVPQVGTHGPSAETRALRRPARAAFFKRFNRALSDLDAPEASDGEPAPPIPIHFSDSMRRRVSADRRRARRRGLHRSLARGLGGFRPLRPLWRTIRPLAFALGSVVGALTRKR